MNVGLLTFIVGLVLAVIGTAAVTRAAGARWINVFLGIALPLATVVAVLFLMHEALREGPRDTTYSVSNAPNP